MPLTQVSGDRPLEQRNDSRAPVIVIAEDDDDARHLYGLILRHQGYDVQEAQSGGEAIQVVQEQQPDLVLMDIGLPDMDGWQASRILKSNPATSGIPVVAFSGRIDSTADLSGDTVSFDGYILKPVRPSEFVRRVNAYIGLFSATARRDVARDRDCET